MTDEQSNRPSPLPSFAIREFVIPRLLTLSCRPARAAHMPLSVAAQDLMMTGHGYEAEARGDARRAVSAGLAAYPALS